MGSHTSDLLDGILIKGRARGDIVLFCFFFSIYGRIHIKFTISNTLKCTVQ